MMHLEGLRQIEPSTWLTAAVVTVIMLFCFLAEKASDRAGRNNPDKGE